MRLPVTVVREETTCHTAVETERTAASAKAEGEAALLELLRAQMTPEGEVVSTRFSAARKGDWLLVTLQAECHEQIARQVVLPQP